MRLLKILFSSSVLITNLLLQSSCGANPAKAPAPVDNKQKDVASPLPTQANVADTTKVNKDSGKEFYIQNALRIKIVAHTATIINEKGEEIWRNDHIIRVQDDQGNCPSEGFRNVAVKGDYFTIEQQNCGGRFFIDEYITFKINKISIVYELFKVGFSYTDRQNPDKNIPDDILTKKDFGKLLFDQVNLDSLYDLRSKKKNSR